MKQVTKTPFIKGLLTAALGPDVDLDPLAVYEVAATSTIPLRGKKGRIFEKAKISPHTISQLSTYVNENPVPLMMDHNMGGEPFGKFFYGEAHAREDGEIELRGLMYVDPSEEQIITKLDNSTIDEVSIQFESQHILCSECGFDYKAAADNGDYMPIMLRTCDKGHEIAKEGVHARLVGVSEVMELSLVSRGAAKNSKIITPSNAKLGESAQRLAASGVDVNDYYCTASMDNEEGVDDVSDALVTKLTALTDEKIDLTTKLNTSEAQVTSLTADVASRDEQIAALTTENTELKAKAPEAEAAIALADTLKDYVGKQYVALKALDGEAEATVPDDLAEAVAYIDGNSARLSALIPPGGVSTGPGGADDDDAAQAKLSATVERNQLASFKTPK